MPAHRKIVTPAAPKKRSARRVKSSLKKRDAAKQPGPRQPRRITAR